MYNNLNPSNPKPNPPAPNINVNKKWLEDAGNIMGSRKNNNYGNIS
jgi:hypothetical protein